MLPDLELDLTECLTMDRSKMKPRDFSSGPSPYGHTSHGHPHKKFFARKTAPLLGRLFVLVIYFLATVQLAWCYLWVVHPYVNTREYELGIERMPFQGRVLMMFPMRWAHDCRWLIHLSGWLSQDRYWWPRQVQPEVIVQTVINIFCLAIAGAVATLVYRAASRTRLLTPLIYPLVLVLAAVTFLLHTIQNFRFVYDLPSLACFSLAVYLVYFHRHKPLFTLAFASLFLVSTLNRETSLLMIPFLLLADALEPSQQQGKSRWRQILSTRTLTLVLPLCFFWIMWQVEVRRLFESNVSEFYSRVPLNLLFLISPHAWPQLLSAGAYLLPFIVLFRKDVRDQTLRAWMWVLPAWAIFMFVYGILIETRIFGELIPYLAVVSALIAEESLLERLRRIQPQRFQMPTEELAEDRSYAA